MTHAQPGQRWGCASLNDCGWTGPRPGRNKEGTEFCPNCGGFVAQRAAETEYASWFPISPYGVDLPDGAQRP